VINLSLGTTNAAHREGFAAVAARAAEAGCDRAIVGSLARRLADALEREAQDMRAYALKREALARGLLTAEEGRAHRETLLLLAGDPALAGPLVNEQERDEAGF